MTSDIKLKTVLDRVEGSRAILIAEDGSLLELPAKLLRGAAEGEEVTVKIAVKSGSSAASRVKHLLEEMLSDDEI